MSTYNVDEVMNHLSDDANLSVSYQLLAFLENVYDYLKAHPLYSIILQNILVVIAVKWAFRKVSNFNYVETFIAVIYINCQFLIIAIANYLYTWNVSD